MTEPFPHLDGRGAARMVDVGGKEVSPRVAKAGGRLQVSDEALTALREATVAKGDALAVARVAGIMGAKETWRLIPLCHQVALTGVEVELVPVEGAVEITVSCRTQDRTGVEMEALTAVVIAGLALHDMIKKIDPRASLTDVRLLTKTGGGSGDWSR